MKINIISSILFNIYFSFCLYYYLGNISENSIIIIMRIIQITGALLFFLEFKLLQVKKHINRIQSISIYILILLFGSILSGLYNSNNMNFLIIFNIIGFYGVALYFVRKKKDLFIIKFFLFASTILFFYYFSLFIHPSQWVTHSQNHVSVVIIFLASIYYLNKINQGITSLSYLPALVACLVSIFSYGRSGIISSLMILLGLVVYRTFLKVSIMNIIMFLAFIIIISLVVDYYFFYINLAINRFYVEGVTSPARLYIFNEWLEEILNSPSIFFGTDLAHIKIYDSLSSHNSFLALHSRFGFASLVIILNIVSIMIIGLKNNVFIFVLLVAVLIRSFTDNILISSGFLFGMLFYCIVLVSDNLKIRGINIKNNCLR